MDTVATVTRLGFEPAVGPRRPGDPARVVAAAGLAARDLDWAMTYSLEAMVRTAWESVVDIN